MKTLYLVRHAKSSWADPFLDDMDRPLNNRGRSDAPRMGKRLRERELMPDLIFSSPAERAVSTSMLIAEKIRYDVRNIQTNARLYQATEDGLLAFTRQLNNANDEVMIVGHNPGLTDFVNSVAGKLVTDNMPTCAVAGIRVDGDSWELVGWGKGKVLFYDFPKNQ